MTGNIFHHLRIALKAGRFAFNRSAREGETLDEILGYIDPLTGIPNRKAFEEDRRRIAVFQTFILIAVDNLKQLNDSSGHLHGDKILRKCAHILHKATEKVGKAYRLSGDEFALIVPHCWVKTVCLYIKNRIADDRRFSVSIGVAQPCGTAGFTDDHFKEAETALNQTKRHNALLQTEYLEDVEVEAEVETEADLPERERVPADRVEARVAVAA